MELFLCREGVTLNPSAIGMDRRGGSSNSPYLNPFGS
jgi:hypothetical protein